MKHKLLLPSLLLLINLTGFCKVWRVTNVHNAFTPSTITIDAGDSVEFDLSSNHDAVEVDKSTYDAKGNTPMANGFITQPGGGMVLPEKLGVGTHYYVCKPHAEIGMLGTIVVNSVTGLKESEILASVSLFPNPTTDII